MLVKTGSGHRDHGISPLVGWNSRAPLDLQT